MKVLPRGDRQPVEGVLQVLPGIDAEFLAGLGEAGQDRQGPSAPVRAEEQPVFLPIAKGFTARSAVLLSIAQSPLVVYATSASVSVKRTSPK